MRTIGALVAGFSEVEKLQLISDYEKFEKDGMIGECLLRSTANTLMPGNPNVVLWMREIAFECYRYYAKKFLGDTND